MIREIEILDTERIRQVYLSSFDGEERELVAGLAIELLNTDSNPKTLHLVADDEGEILGHVSFSPVMIKDSQKCLGYILALLAVSPEHQKRGVGSMLVREGLERLMSSEATVVLLYGDPDYYGRFGFSSELAEKYIPPFPLRYPSGWQALALSGELVPKDPKRITCVEPLNKPELW